jgi:hypothetical protein
MNRTIIVTVTIIFYLSAVNAQQRDSFTVYLFLLEDCKITQAYTDKISDIYGNYVCDSIGFIALFPNPVSSDTTVADFREKYQLPVRCTTLEARLKALLYGITITPEVAIVNETTQELLYRGRIDNMFERVGERRRVVTSFELEAALYAIRHCKDIPVPRTMATGCFLPLKQ